MKAAAQQWHESNRDPRAPVGTARFVTVAEVLTDTETAMGLVPLGIVNLLARKLGINVTDPVAAGQEVLHGTETKIDVLTATLDHAERMRIFLVAAGPRPTAGSGV